MRIVTVGRASFVSGFRLAGVEGVEVEDSQQAMGVISGLFEEHDLGLLLVYQYHSCMRFPRLGAVRRRWSIAKC